MDSIVLRIEGSSWVATHYGPLARHICRAFGTATLPTAYTNTTPAQVVLAAIRKLNPDCSVSLG